MVVKAEAMHGRFGTLHSMQAGSELSVSRDDHCLIVYPFMIVFVMIEYLLVNVFVLLLESMDLFRIL